MTESRLKHLASFGFVLLILLLSKLALGAPSSPSAIPRTPTRHFVEEGLFQGGGAERANLEKVTMNEFAQEGFERWTMDFSDPKTKKVGTQAPTFQIRYLKTDRFSTNDGQEVQRAPAKFLILLRSISQNRVSEERFKALALQSKFVKNVIVYPAIEDGDMAIELILKDDVLFETHQPIEKAGRLVLDLKSKSQSS